ncbi:hypothetical protein GDO81_020184 [Engystomops pustulosus]|uniref:Uncharacterized protein n=1 Tax=Engystomops pustulosus TaxID=76066 RepID=A0AAV6Z8J1_ENGPU|nr:hypothetical protein GDO81_020184 [Engystomops pustulosus]
METKNRAVYCETSPGVPSKILLFQHCGLKTNWVTGAWLQKLQQNPPKQYAYREGTVPLGDPSSCTKD